MIQQIKALSDKLIAIAFVTKREEMKYHRGQLETAKDRDELSLIEVKCSIGVRENLGRPTTTAPENKDNFMKYISTL